MSTLEEVLAMPLDSVEDHDYFAIKRRERMKKRDDQRIAHEKELKAIRRKKLEAGWKEDGEDGMKNMKTSLNFLQFILTPHSKYKQCMQHLLVNVEQGLSKYSKERFLHRHRGPAAVKTLLVEVSARRQQQMLSKSRLIHYKFGIMRELKSHFLINHSAKWEFQKTPKDLTITRHLFRVFMLLIRVNASTRKELTRRREIYNTAVAKHELIHRTQAQCDFILHCTSAQHQNPNGCTRCGVLYMHGMLDGGTMYVKSVSRDTGVSTLVTLDFEIETLRQEDEIQMKIVNDARERLEEYENVVLNDVLTNMQQWIAFVYAYRHCKKVESQQKQSLYKHRIRRLVVLKKEIDSLIIEAPPIDMQYCEDKYWDIMEEMREYVALQTNLKEIRIRKWADRFRRRLHVLVEEGRERRYQEWLRLQSIPPPPKPLVIKTVTQTPVIREFVCFRLECKMRKFISKERYDIHMAVHHRADQERYRKYEEQQRIHVQRQKDEAQFMDRVNKSRLHLLQQVDDDLHSSRDSFDEFALEYSYDDRDIHPSAGIASGEGVSSKTLNSMGGRSTQILVPETNYHISAGSAFAATAAAARSVQIDAHHRSADHRQQSMDSASALLGMQLVPHPAADDDQSVGSLLLDQERKNENQQLQIHPINVKQFGKADDRHGYNDITNYDSDVHSKHEAGDSSMRVWKSFEHIYTLNGLQNTAMYSLEMVSKQGDVDVPQKVPLDHPVIRVGTHSSCELQVKLHGAAKRDGKIAKVHCLLYCPMYDRIHSHQRQQRDLNTDLTIVDNHSSWGTYVVSPAGTIKVPSKVTAGTKLQSGLLVCIGVCEDGPKLIPPTLANQACVVYRVRCIDTEENNKSIANDDT